MDKAQEAAKAVTPENLHTAQQYIDFVKQNLEPMAQQIGVSVQWLWDILVMQARVEAIIYLVVLVLGAVKGVLLLLIAYKAYKNASFGDGETHTIYKHKKTGVETDYMQWADYGNSDKYNRFNIRNTTNVNGWVAKIAGGLGLALTVVTIISAPIFMPTIVTGLVNPQFRAIEKIVEFANGRTQTTPAEKGNK